MDVIHAPIGLCKTRMRRGNNFAKDDPLYCPQPYHPSIGHLSVIPYPSGSPDNPLRWAWYQPSPNDFEVVNSPGLMGVVCLAPYLELELAVMCSSLRKAISKLPDEQKCDSWLVRGRDRLHKHLERISRPGAQKIVALELAYLQRVFLETYGRWQWFEKWVPRLKDVNSFHETDPNVMGAFTEELDDVADLFRIGIPVWLVRPLEQQPTVRIDQFVLPLDEVDLKLLPLHNSSLQLDVSDEVPPYPIIYRGLHGGFVRYRRIAAFLLRHWVPSSMI